MKSDDNYKDKELLERLRRDEDVHPDEVNAFLFRSGLRRCPHSEHDSDAAIAACTGGSLETNHRWWVSGGPSRSPSQI